MITISEPTHFSPAFVPVLYSVEAVDKNATLDVEICAPTGNNAPIGIKRFKNDKHYTVNVANYYRRFLNPQPKFSEQSALFTANDKQVYSSIKVGANKSSPIHLTAGREYVKYGTPFSNFPSIVEIAPDEFDEITFYSPLSELSIEAVLSGASGERTIPITSQDCDVTLYTFVLNMSHIGRVVGSDSLKGYSTLTIKATGTRRVSFKKEYRIVPSSSSGVRICWLNPQGGIDYYTFSEIMEESVNAKKSRLYSSEGHNVLGSSTNRSRTIVSKNEPKESMRWLAEVIASPKVWIVEQQNQAQPIFTEVDVLTNSALIHSELPASLTLKLRDKANTNSQNC